jgi:predicted  nucleic acid-binding Zn-ribbon protein
MENTGDSEILVNSILEDVEIPRPEKNEFQDLSDIALEIDDETIHLNTPDKHYYELFEKVRSEAKEAKKRAKEAYLKAKNIKKSYMLETMSESSDETIDSLLDMDDMDDMNDMDDIDENTQTEELTLET